MDAGGERQPHQSELRPADGYTLAVAAAGPMAVNPSLYDKLPYDPTKDFSPITNLEQGALPVGDTPEQFGAYIKAEIDKWGAVVRAANIKAD